MEPMALGSPSSPSPGSTYLPSFLMGESNTSTAPRSNTLSPSKGRALAFGKRRIANVSSSKLINSLNFSFPSNARDLTRWFESFDFATKNIVRISANTAQCSIRECLATESQHQCLRATNTGTVRLITNREKCCCRKCLLFPERPAAEPNVVQSID